MLDLLGAEVLDVGLERGARDAPRPGAHGALLVLGKDVLTDGGLNALTVDWVTVGGFAAGGVVLSILTSAAATRRGSSQDPTFTG